MRLHRLARLALALVAALLLCPVAARAENYSVTNVAIDALVEADGSLYVVESRTFYFGDAVNGVYWTIPLTENEQGAASDIQVISVSEGSGADATHYTQAASAELGDRGVYTAETDDGVFTLKVFTPHLSGDEATISLGYRLSGAVMAWQDTAELYWKFVGSDWTADSENVSLDVSFASSELSGVAATTGDDANFRAWGHGPLSGEVALDADDDAISYAAPVVSSGEYAEARVAFPLAWVPDIAGASPEARMETILAEEQEWASEANEQREQEQTRSALFAGIGVAVPAVFLVIVIILKVKAGPKFKPAFQETYWRDVPSDDHPAVIAAFMNGGNADNKALVATLMKLADEKCVSISRTTHAVSGLFGVMHAEDDYSIGVSEEARSGIQDKIDWAAIDIYLDDDEQNTSFIEMEERAKRSPERFEERWNAFASEVDDRLGERGLVVSEGLAATVTGTAVAALSCFVSIVMAYLTGSVPVAAIGIVLAVAGMCISWTFKRYSQEGVELRARCLALKKWLEDFTRLGEAVPGDVVLWNKLLVMAVALGVSEKVLEELAAVTPREFDSFYADDGYCPSWWWLRQHGDHGSPYSCMHEAVGHSLGTLSSGSGDGGGFSGGGGGGTGGGGGGTF